MRLEGIADTCFCIDLWNGHLLEILIESRLRIIIPDIVANELHTPDVKPFIESGVEIKSAGPEEVRLVEELSQSYRKTSIADLFALAMAKSGNIFLFTNDKHLRMAAIKENVNVKGILWFLDSLENKMSGDHLASALEKVLAGGARLPPDECRARLTKWRSGT